MNIVTQKDLEYYILSKEYSSLDNIYFSSYKPGQITIHAICNEKKYIMDCLIGHDIKNIVNELKDKTPIGVWITIDVILK